MNSTSKYFSFLFWIGISSFSFYASGQTLSAEKIYENVNDAIVKIYKYQDTGRETAGQGSGVILRKYAWVITNYHVIRNANFIKAVHNDKTYDIDSIVSMDTDKDIVVLQMKNAELVKKNKNIPDIVIGDSKKLKVGQKIYAIGSPKGYENTMTDGIVSGLRTEEEHKNLIQISAPISPGSSGGAIVNEKGELVGISSSIVVAMGSQNLNFAIPVNDVIELTLRKNASGGGPETYLTGQSLAKYYYDKGNEAFKTGKFDTAIIYFTKTIPLSTNIKKPIAFYALGLANERSGKIDAAKDNFEAAIKYAPNFAEAYYELFQVYANKSDLQRAVENQMIAYRLKPELKRFKNPYKNPPQY